MTNKINWLHISDLHVGMTNSDWLWPTVKTSFYSDLPRVLDSTGPLDLVVFSGDLTQAGSASEFARATDILGEFWKFLNQCGSNPPLIVVPGNHDLTRPASTDPALLLLRQWWDMPIVQTSTLDDPTSIYRNTISCAFANYEDWLKQLELSAIPLAMHRPGMLPGDFSSVIPIKEHTVGVIGLSSSWLQLDASNFEKKLDIHTKQILAVTDGDPEAWCARNAANLIITHHPTDWLHPEALARWQSDIYPPGRFDAHLFGHMHEPNLLSIAIGGSASRHSIQAASIFGLERIGQSEIKRIHGYSVAQIEPGVGVRVWPRRALLQTSGSWKLVPDETLDLDNQTVFLPTQSTQSRQAPAAERPNNNTASTRLIATSLNPQSILDRIRYFMLPAPAARGVRQVEQEIALRALNSGHSFWLSANWGAGQDGFVRSVIEKVRITPDRCYRIEVGDYVGRNDLFASIRSKTNSTFEEICEALSNIGPSLLILSDVCVSGDVRHLVPDIEDLVAIVHGYCSELSIILELRGQLQGNQIPCITLQPLDEADLKSYVASHEHGGPSLAAPSSIAAIYRHTDGIPARVDSTLRQLDIITIDQLALTDRDLVAIEGHVEDTPPALVSAIQSLASSKEPVRVRSFQLLKALSSFPRGESLDRIKRFAGAHPFYPSHARELVDESLLHPTNVIVGSIHGSAEKILVVPRSVRDYVRSTTSVDELRDLTKQAASLYFGPDWHLGKIRPSLAARLGNSTASEFEITNAISIVARLLHDAIERNNARAFRGAVEIARSLMVLLVRADHYKSAATLGRDVLAIDLKGNQSDETLFKYELARALRMLDFDEEAVEILQGLDQSEMPAQMRQTLEIISALAFQYLERNQDAIAAAKRVLNISKTSFSALQAQEILLVLGDQDDTTKEKLRKLEVLCKKRGANTLVCNMAYLRAKRPTSSPEEIDEALDTMMKLATKANDTYNRTRAIIERVRVANDRNSLVSEQEKTLLISAYQFLFVERMGILFDQCHSALWKLFERSGENSNLFRLFRHSSLIWRLRGDPEIEERYLKRLAKHATAFEHADVTSAPKETAYYLVRIGQGPKSYPA